VKIEIGRFKLNFEGSAPRQKSSQTLPLLVQDYEEKLGIEQPFNFLNPAKGYRNVSWVYACVNAIMTAVASVPLSEYRQRGSESRPIEGAISELFWNVNPYLTRTDLWEWTCGSLELYGTSYWEIERNGAGKPIALYPLHPARVTIVPDKVEFIRGFIYEVNGREIALDREDVFLLKYWNPDSENHGEHYGIGSYQAGSRIVTIDTWAQSYNESFFKYDATPGGALETDQPLDEDSAKLARKRWEEVHSGRQRSHRIAILSEGLKYKPTQPTMRDMTFVELRKMNREEICAVFRVPPAIVGIFEYANYANAKEQQSMFWKNRIVPLLVKIQEALNQGFVPHFNDSSLYVEFDLSNVEALREDQNQKATRENILVRSGLRTINELRAADNLPPVEWGDQPPEPASPGIPGQLALPSPRSKVQGPGAKVQGPRSKSIGHYDVTRQMPAIYRPAKALFGDLAAEMVRWLKSDGRLSRLRAYAQSTEPVKSGGGAGHGDSPESTTAKDAVRNSGDSPLRDANRDRAIVRALFSGFDPKEIASSRRLEADFADPYKSVYEKGAKFGARKLRAAAKALKMSDLSDLSDASDKAALSDRSEKKEFVLVDDNILKQLADRRAFWLAHATDETYDGLLELLTNEYFGRYQQATDAELVAKIQRLFNYDTAWRAERTAKTETHHIAQNAQREMFKRADVRYNEWRHSGNPNGRPNHIELDGATINVSAGEKFRVGSYYADGPGDPGLGPEESINCECDTWPSIGKDGEYELPDELWSGD